MRARPGRWTLVVAVALCVLAPASAGADVQLGQTYSAVGCLTEAQTRIQSVDSVDQSIPSYKAPFDGIIMSWTVIPNDATLAQLKIARPAGGDSFQVVAESDVKVLDIFQIYPIHLPVRAGDIIGIYTDRPCAEPAAGATFHFANGNVPAGTPPGPFTPQTGFRLNVSATMEPDADADGFADETEDDCKREPGPDEGCPLAAAPAPTDVEPPDTQITGGPKQRTKKTFVTFEFTSSEPDPRFECSFDGEPFRPCASPEDEKVRKGKHSFSVRAKDAAGNIDPTPATFDWKVKKKK